MEKRNSIFRGGLPTIALCILVALLWPSPCAGQFVDAGETAEIDYAIENDFLMVFGTANLYPGAYIDWGVYAATGSVINIYGGEIGDGFFILLYTGEPVPIVTVYGKEFALDGVPLDPSIDYFMTGPYGYGVLTGTYENGDPIDLLFYSDVPVYLKILAPEIMIDIKPGSEQNNINLKSNGVVPVAVLTTEEFDAATIDPTTIELAGAAPKRWKLMDVDDDGDDDMMLLFKTQELDLNDESTNATLTAQVSDGTTVSGIDEIRIVPSHQRNRRRKLSRQ